VTTPVFFTVDTALSWRHHADGLDLPTIVERSFDPAGVGVAWQLGQMARHGLKGVFFVDPMPALAFGLDPIRRVVDTILDAGQEVQLQLHPVWAGAVAGDGGAQHGRSALSDYDATAQRDLIAGARDLLVAAGAPSPIAFRAGDFTANEDTLRALATLDFDYDCSGNGDERPGALGLAPRQIAPVAHCGVTEVPVTLIEERVGALCNVRVSALSAGEMRAALGHAVAQDHAAMTIVSGACALANRAGTRENGIHVRRFVALCAMLAERRDTLPTCWFGDRPALRLGQNDVPLEPHHLRTGWRQAEQLWTHMVEERAA
jgi:hypothetical protein